MRQWSDQTATLSTLIAMANDGTPFAVATFIMWEKWIFTDWTSVAAVALGGAVTYATIVVYVRVAGLRSFSKMTAPDFAMTVAVGSLFASTLASPNPSLLLGLFALSTLFFGQWFVALLRRKFPAFSRLTDNQPLLLMRGDQIIDANLKQANVTRHDLFAKLREANVLNFEQVRAVVLETTGDISVLHTDDDSVALEAAIFQNVIDFPLDDSKKAHP